MARQARQTVFVEKSEIREAIAAIDADVAAGKLSAAEAGRRTRDCWRAVTPRDLWKASDGRAGVAKRQDWWDIRRTVYSAIFILILCALGMWLVTWTLAQMHGQVPGAGGGGG
jgi:hypothetical protein